jgi:tripartite-type tricarboxylate transporter receptor subunit TctC
MKKRFRALIALIAITLGVLAVPAHADTWPSKPIRIVVPNGAGGTSDILARTLGQKLTEAWGQPVLVDNRPGANGNIGAEIVARAPPDGYTLMLHDVGNLTISPSLYPNLAFDPAKDLAPVTMITYSPHLLVVRNSLNVKSVQELIAYAKANPGKLNQASAGAGSASQLAGVLFAQRAGIEWVHVPYKGGAPALADLAAGQADVLFNGMLATYPFVKTGKIRALAISSEHRNPTVPDLPTISETALPGFVTGSWQGLFASPGTPKEVIAKLNAEIARILALPEIKERLANQGAEPRASSPEQFGTFVRDEIAKWSKVVKDAGVKLE